jgi:putative phosphoesterase
MRIGLISDTHNEQHKVKLALEKFRQHNVELILHAGDITSTATLKLFTDFDVWISRGNMDRDRQLAKIASQLFGPGRFATTHELQIDGATIALLHGDSWTQLESRIKSKRYNYVIHGHTHVPQDEKIGQTRVINPGALGHARWHAPTCAVLDLTEHTLEWIEF